MSWRGKSWHTDLFAGVASSGSTSNEIWVGDAREMTFFIGGSNSTTTIQGSNASGGHGAASGPRTIPEWSWTDLHTEAQPSNPAMVNVEPGFRWTRALRSSASTVLLNFRR